MRAAEAKGGGSCDVPSAGASARAPVAGEVRLDAAAATIDPAGLPMTGGRHEAKPRRDFVPGPEAAARVAAAGDGAGPAVGDPVPPPGDGCWTETAAAGAHMVTRRPSGVDPMRAAMRKAQLMPASATLRRIREPGAGGRTLQNAADPAAGQDVAPMRGAPCAGPARPRGRRCAAPLAWSGTRATGR